MQNPFNRVFLDTVNLSTIVKDGELGDPERLSKFVRLLRPDITDTRALVLFEIKPDTEEARRQGRELSWRTPEPGVTLYRWSYRRKQPNASWKERAAQKEEQVPQEEVDCH